MPLDPNILQPGDILLYRPRSFFGWLIAIKTWNKISHVEMYAGRNEEGRRITFAAREGVGVDMFPLSTKDVARVLRPPKQFEFGRAADYFHAVAKGQKYDWKGILCFTLAVKQGAIDRQFCSELATRLLRVGLYKIFGSYDADKIAPAQFLMTDLPEIYTDGK